MSDQTKPLECDCCGGTWGYINAESDEHDNSFDCIAELTQQRDAAVRQNVESTDQAHNYAQLWEASAQEVASLRAGLAACERVVEAAKSVLAESEEVWGTTDALVNANLLAALRAAVAADTQENAIRTAHQIDVGEYVSASALDVPALLEEVRRFKRAFYQEFRDNMRDAATPLFAELEKRKEVP